MDNHAVVEVENLSYSPDRIPLLQHISFKIFPGEIIILAGKSGTGKTLLLKLIAGLIIPDSGKIFRNNAHHESINPNLSYSRPGADCGLVFQDGALLDDIPVWENIAFQWLEQTIQPKQIIFNKAQSIALQLGLQVEDLTKLPAALSGGMRKKVAIGRTIAHQPNIILYDEPTAGLDPAAADSINDLIREVRNHNNSVALIVTHDLNTLRKVGDRVLFLQDGRIQFDGKVDSFFQSQMPVIREFLGIK